MSRTLAAVALALLPLGSAMAQDSPADVRYCAALSELYGRYVGSTEFGMSNRLPRDVEARYALYRCERGEDRKSTRLNSSH